MPFEKISVIGLGYIGLPTAAMFASKKKKVIGVDVNEYAINTINKGNIHIVEPYLDKIVRSTVSEGYLKAKTTAEEADAFLIAVPTPFKDNHEPDLSYIESACSTIAPVLKKGDLVILESTSPVGATEEVAKWLSLARPDLTFPQDANSFADIQVAHCPERVLPGHVVRELVENDRVIGGMSEKCSQKALELYKIFVEGECIITNARTAEMAKLTENSCRDVQIAFANELSIICDKLDIDVWELIELANRHPRVNILQPGPGVGGHCIAVDPWFIINKTPNEAKLIHNARLINDYKPQWVIQKVKEAISEIVHHSSKQISQIKITCLGLSFKANIDDLRESPALNICQELASKYPNQIKAVEPNIEQLPKKFAKLNIKLINLNDAISSSDIVLLLVNHKEFELHNYKQIDSQILIDTKGIWR